VHHFFQIKTGYDS